MVTSYDVGTQPRVRAGDGTRIISVALEPGSVTDPKESYSPEQRQAQLTAGQAKQAHEAAMDELAGMRAQVGAARALAAFLKSVTGAALTALDPVGILDTSIAVGQKITEAEREIAPVAPALRDQKQTVAAAAGALKQAKQRLAALSPPQGPVDTLVIQVERDTAGGGRAGYHHAYRGGILVASI